MGQTPDEITQQLAERWCWPVARREATRSARRLYRQHRVEGGYRLDEGARREEVLQCRHERGVRAMRQETHGAGRDRVRVPCVPSLWRYGVKPLGGIARRTALPTVLCSAEALRPWVGCKTQPRRDGGGQRGAAKRPGERALGPLGSATLAKPIVPLHRRDVAVVVTGARRAVVHAGGCAATGTGRADGTDRATPPRAAGCGQVTRQGRLAEPGGRRHASAVTVDGGHVLRVLEAAAKRPVAVQVGPIAAQATHGTRAVIPQARANLAGTARLPHVVFAQGGWAGTDRWWLNPQGLRCVGPATATRAVTADAAGEGRPLGRRGHTVRHGQGQGARTARLATAVGGSTGLPTDAHDGPVEHGRYATRRACAATPLNAVVGRPWHGRDDGPGGHTVCLPHAPVQQPGRPLDDDDDRRLIAHGGITATTQPGHLGQPPQQTARAGRVPVRCTRLMFALATASRVLGAHEATGGEPVGWHGWRRRLLQQTRDQVIVCAHGDDGLFQIAAYARWRGVRRNATPPGLGTRQDILANYRLTPRSSWRHWNLRSPS